MALRDIRAGEQLYLSYNECTDCMYERDYAYTYVLQYILRDYGFVEVRYPASLPTAELLPYIHAI